MSGARVRITSETQLMLRELAEESNEPVREVLAKAVDLYRRQRILKMTNVGYAALRADAAQWREVQEERAQWDAMLAEGLENNQH